MNNAETFAIVFRLVLFCKFSFPASSCFVLPRAVGPLTCFQGVHLWGARTFNRCDAWGSFTRGRLALLWKGMWREGMNRLARCFVFGDINLSVRCFLFPSPRFVNAVLINAFNTTHCLPSWVGGRSLIKPTASLSSSHF